MAHWAHSDLLLSSPKQPCPTTTVASDALPMSLRSPATSLLQTSYKNRWTSKPGKLYRILWAIFRLFPLSRPTCKLPSLLPPSGPCNGPTRSWPNMTGTLFGHRKARVSLAIQDTPKCRPMLLLDLAIQTGKLLQEMDKGLVRIALECEKRAGDGTKVIEEPMWAMFCNGRKMGYSTKRVPTEEDLNVIDLLQAVSMGAGVLPGPATGEMMYMRAHFERVVGSTDSETYYMMGPDVNNGPELSIFFVRI